MAQNLAFRSIFPLIEAHLQEEEITVILGPRQVGKTTLLTQLKNHLTDQNLVPPKNIYSFNLDVASDMAIFRKQTDFINFIKNRTSGNQKIYVFVDESQRIKDTGLFFKGIYDLHLPVKLILTGSSSLDIKSKINEPLTGRKRLFLLFPFNFWEYLNFQDSELLNFIGKDDQFAKEKILNYLFDFILFGGYPKIALEQNREKKSTLLEEIYTSYIEKDVISFLNIKNSFSFSQLIKVLGFEIGNLFNINKFSQELHIKNTTLSKYLALIEQTFIARRVPPFSKSPRSEIRKMSKVYFFDTGLRNFAKSQKGFMFDNYQNRTDKGMLLENFIFNELQKMGINQIYFWRTKSDAEVDFVIEHKGQIIPIEVKSELPKTASFSRSYSSFLKKYHSKLGIVISFTREKWGKIEGTDIKFLLPHQLNQFITAI